MRIAVVGAGAFGGWTALHLRNLGFVVDKLTLADAKTRYPQIDFRGVKSVWLERKAGALYASRACGIVRDAFVKGGGTYRTATVEPGQVGNGLKLKDGSRVDA